MPAPPSAGGLFRAGFTLIELLVVMVILGMLSSMLFALFGIAERSAKRTNTLATLARVDGAIRAFHNELRVYPSQTDLSDADANPAKWTNDLSFRLQTAAKSSDQIAYLAAVRSDLAAVNQAFIFRSGTRIGMAVSDPINGDGTHAFRNDATSTNILLQLGSRKATPAAALASYVTGNPSNISRMLTEVVRERSVLMLLAGSLPLLAPVGNDPATTPGEDDRYAGPLAAYKFCPYNAGTDARGPVLKRPGDSGAAAAAQSRGWRGDYLNDSPASAAAPAAGTPVDEALVDAWGRPLIYLCQVSPRVFSSVPSWYGEANPNSANFGESRYGLEQKGRLPTASLDSDIRTTASAAFTVEFELWSAGPDGLFGELRNDPRNKDNVPAADYLRGLSP